MRYARLDPKWSAPGMNITLKAGDTFFVKVTYRDDEGNPVVVGDGAVTIKSAFKSDSLVYPLIVTYDPDQTANPGEYTISLDDTQELPITTLSWDRQYTLDGKVWSSQTDTITIERDVTP